MPKVVEFNGVNEASFWNGQYGKVPWLQSLDDAKAIGANTIAITATSYLSTKTSSTIFSTSQTESLANVAQAVGDAKANGLTAILKPHIDVLDTDWRGRLDPANDAAFFKNYKAWILDYAKVAQAQHADMLVIGTELDQLAGSQYHAQWADIVASIRQVYSGPLTYAANADGKVGLWDLVDYIGVNPYLALSTNKAATTADFVKAWTTVSSDPGTAKAFGGLSVADYYEQLSKTYNKPLLMTEVGYRSLDGTAADPGHYAGTGKVDQKEQAALFDALFQVFSTESSWMKGTLLWGWTTDKAAVQASASWATGYGFEGKAAEDVVAKWYGGPSTGSATPTVDLTLKLAANVAGGPALAAVVVDRQLVGTIEVGNTLNVKGSNFKDYHLDVPLSKNADGSAHTVEVYFLNPAPGRGLHVDAISLGGQRYEAEAAGSGKTFVTAYNSGTISSFKVSDALLSDPVPIPVKSDVVTEVHANGSRDVYLSNIKDHSYTAEHAAYDAAGILTAVSRTHADGSTDYDYSFDQAAGIKVTDQYDAAGQALVSHVVALASGAPAEALNGTSGSDYIYSAGNSLITAGSGHDSLNARTADTVRAGSGNDTINLSGLPNMVDGGAGSDTIILRGSFALDPFYMRNIEKFTVADGGSFDFGRFSSNLNITASGGSAGTHIIGGSGNDVITAVNSMNYLDGGSGNDILQGGNGADVLTGGFGQNVLGGGGGNDTFVFKHDGVSSGLTDTIRDFTAKVGNMDTILLDGFTAKDVHLTSVKDGVLMTLDLDANVHHDVILTDLDLELIQGHVVFA